jgi:hypothetical protein
VPDRVLALWPVSPTTLISSAMFLTPMIIALFFSEGHLLPLAPLSLHTTSGEAFA